MQNEIHQNDLSNYRVRLATSDDAAIIAHHRAQMFRDMGHINDTEVPEIESACRPYLAEMLAAGEYMGWLVEFEEKVVAGGGIILRRLLPRPGCLQGGEEAYVLNVYTEPHHRRRKLARMLLEAMIEWCERRGVARITLHASDAGRPLYESLGFVSTNEMRLRVASNE